MSVTNLNFNYQYTEGFHYNCDNYNRRRVLGYIMKSISYNDGIKG